MLESRTANLRKWMIVLLAVSISTIVYLVKPVWPHAVAHIPNPWWASAAFIIIVTLLAWLQISIKAWAATFISTGLLLLYLAAEGAVASLAWRSSGAGLGDLAQVSYVAAMNVVFNWPVVAVFFAFAVFQQFVAKPSTT